MDWFELLRKQTAENEAPDRYFWWAGLAAISAVVRKNVYLNRGSYYKLYTNIFVALVSSRSGARKALPISLCKSMLEECSLCRVISGQNSIQGLIKALSLPGKTLTNGSIPEAQAIMISDEFDAFFVKDPQALTTLTSLFNTHEHNKSWVKTLKGKDSTGTTEELKNLCLSMLVASNETLFEAAVANKDIEGGFIARTFIVYETMSKLINPLMDLPKIELDVKELIPRLKQIAEIKGEFIWTNEAKSIYGPWYHRLRTLAPSFGDRTGTLDRLGDQVLKVAMLISLARKDDLYLTAEDISLAIRKCGECMKSVADMTSTTYNGMPIRKVFKILMEAPNREMSRPALLRKLHRDGIDSFALDRVVDNLYQAKAIVQFTRGEKKEVIYKVADEAYEGFDQHFLDVINGA
jgi:hypothetical protein